MATICRNACGGVDVYAVARLLAVC